MSRRIITVLKHSHTVTAPPKNLFNFARPPLPFHGHCLVRKSIRHASSSSNTSSGSLPSKTIVLEQPDKFRPPSHPQRLNKRPPRQYPGPPLSQEEREAQKTKRYPHMFPNEGSFMYWFLTNRWLHVWITLGTLMSLAVITLAQNFLHTSPFAHLVPPISTLPFHPWAYMSEALSALRLHIDYNTEVVAEQRRNQVLDAQKRRLYRRAHGMEDLNAEEESGVDVRGLVPWDDGLTNKERAAGGRSPELIGKMLGEMETKKDGKWVKVRDLAREEMAGGVAGTGQSGVEGLEGWETLDADGNMVQQDQQEQQPQPPRRKKVKRWLGIWE